MLLAGLLALLVLGPAGAVEVYEEYHKLIGKSQSIAAHGDNLFGEQVDLYTGRTSFSQTDISLPGNNPLQVALTRKLDVDVRDEFNDVPGIGLWEFDVPKLSGIFSQADGWTVNTATPQNRCSIAIGSYPQARPKVAYAGSVAFGAEEFWSGNQMHIPGAGAQQMLVATAQSKVPSAGGPYPWVTKNGWVFRCIPLASGGSGQGFVAVSPEGVKYTFDRMAVFSGNTLSAQLIKHQEMERLDGSGIIYFGKFRLNRVRIVILGTKVEDRFGNWVNYQYDTSNRLTRIVSNDGREIALSYAGNPATSVTATAAGRTWTYTANALQLPDGSQWAFSGNKTGVIDYWESEASIPNTCGGFPLASMITGSSQPSLTMTHPSGATGVFDFQLKIRGRSYVLWDCPVVPEDHKSLGTLWQAKEYPVFALVSKTLSGTGVEPSTWSYAYSPDNGSFLGLDTSSCGASCPRTVWTEVTRPDGTKVKSTFGNKYNDNEGQLLAEETKAGGTVLKLVQNAYVAVGEVDSHGFLDRIGISPQSRGAMLMSDAQRPLKSSVTTQQGVNFSYIVDDFDDHEFARPSLVTRASTTPGSPSRTEATEYHDNAALWVMGQTRKTICMASVPANAACDGGTDSEMTETGYDPAWAVPVLGKQFGKTIQTLTYDTAAVVASGQRGTVRTVKDGNNNVTTLASWKRGIPQAITHADGNTSSGVVNDRGWITAVNDELNSKTCYAYDPMGRITSITYTSEAAANTCNTSTWAVTTAGFTKSATAKYGLPAGHWQQTLDTGNGRKRIYFDALWRPVVEEAFDNANAAVTRSITVKRYDVSGRLAFQSYPMASLSSHADAGLKGTFTTYDALGRPTQVKQDWEGTGQLVTTTEYLAGFKTRVTPPRGQGMGSTYQTTTEYMAYDQAAADWPVRIGHPEGAYTHITRDPYGKPTRIRRSNNAAPTGGTVFIDRTYTYGGEQMLCTVTEPETGSSVHWFDGAGNLVRTAGGLAIAPGTSCADAKTQGLASGRTVLRTYDTRNRLTTLTFADGQGNQTWTYTPDGLPASVTSPYDNGTREVVNTYTYNRRRLLTYDGQAITGWGTFYLTHAYNANGHLASTTWPGGYHGPSVDFAPNALGQPTQAGTFASNASYFPNGALKQFTYGNGIVHTLAQNVRGLPMNSRDAYGGTEFIDDNYAYDQHGNVLAITDGANGRNQQGNRDMAYDALDRLTQVASGNGAGAPMFGTATYAYDVLDNLTRVHVTGGGSPRNHHYCYDATWRLTNVKTGSCSGSTVVGLGYDLQGNLSNKNGQAYVFDLGNRLRSVPGREDGYAYDADGRRAISLRYVGGSSALRSAYSRDGRLVFQQDQGLTTRKDFIYLGSQLVAERSRPSGTGTPVTVRYQHTDALGSPVVVTNEARAEIERTYFEPYGQPAQRTGNPVPRNGIGYTGHVEDAATGLNYMQQRYYDPMLGVFLSVDPVTAYSNPMGQFHRYRYANNNPYRFTDPDGREVRDCVRGEGCGSIPVVIRERREPVRDMTIPRRGSPRGYSDGRFSMEGQYRTQKAKDGGLVPKPHKGTDLFGPNGTPVTAAAAGRVVSVGEMRGFGPHTAIVESISADGTTYQNLYGHMSSETVSKGDYVAVGQQVGVVGEEGNSGGAPHLHFEVSIGQWSMNAPRVDPMIWLQESPILELIQDFSKP